MSQTPIQNVKQEQEISYRRPTTTTNSNNQIQNRRKSSMNLRKKSGTVAVALLLAVQACSLGNQVSARPNGILQQQDRVNYLGQFPSVTAISSSASMTSSSSVVTSSTPTNTVVNNAEDKEMPILLEQNPPSPTSSSMNATETSSIPAPSSQPSTSASLDMPSEKQEMAASSSSSKIKRAEDDSNTVSQHQNNEQDQQIEHYQENEERSDSEDSQSCESSDDASSDDTSSDDGAVAKDEQQHDKGDDNRLKAFPILPSAPSPIDQIGNILPIKRDHSATKRDSWFSTSSSPPTKMSIQKDDAAMYALMKRMIDSNEEQMKVQRRVLDEIDRRKRSEDDPASTTSSTSPTGEEAEGSPKSEEKEMKNQWNEHEDQNEAQQKTKRDDLDPNSEDNSKRHQLLISAMNDWNYVSSWLSNHLPVELHKQVEQALRTSSAGTIAKEAGQTKASSSTPAVQKAVADSVSGNSIMSSDSKPSYVNHGNR